MATPVDNAVPLTGNPLIDGLTQGSAWQFSGPRVLTYSFSLYDVGAEYAWTPTWRNAIRQALEEWSNVADITFSEVGSGTDFTVSPADIAFSLSGRDLSEGSITGLLAAGIFPSPTFASLFRDAAKVEGVTYANPEGDVFFDHLNSAFASVAPGTYGYTALMHEIGHALGLKHPYDDGGNGRPTYAALGVVASDDLKSSVMSGDDNGVAAVFASYVPATPMALDIRAIQAIYGPNLNYRTGDDVYAITASPQARRAIWDAGGTDTLDCSGVITSFGVSIDLATPSISLSPAASYVSLAVGTVIENVIGSSDRDTIYGNEVDNEIDGRAGVDILAGRRGNDTYVIDRTDDVVIETPGEGSDTILIRSFQNFSAPGYVLPANVENLTILANAYSYGSTLSGNPLDNVLTSAMSGTLAGNRGNDVYILQVPGIAVIENSDEGNDEVRVSQTYTLPANVERLTLLGNAAIDATGNGLNNTLTGNAGINRLAGLTGDDTYYIQALSDVVVENAAEGNDTVAVPFTYTLAIANVENVLLSGSAAVDASGDAGANRLTGNSAANVLTGLAGDDALFGRGGDDTAVYAGTRASYTVTKTSTGYTVSGAEGADTLRGVEWLRFSDATVRVESSPQRDVGGDGQSDLLWRHANGTFAIWEMNGAVPTATPVVAAGLTQRWQVTDVADFSGDGKADLLWRQDDGHVAIWTMDGTTPVTTPLLGRFTDWRPLKGADFDGDGKSDILWRHDNGTVAVWTMNGTTPVAGSVVATVGNDWRIVDTGDFNGDAKADLVWQHDGGSVAIWLMDGTTPTATPIVANFGTAWSVAKVADFDGDGKSDLLWASNGGTTALWAMDGTTPTSTPIVANLGTSWQAIGARDFGGDGRADILWRHTNGTVALWEMDGANVLASPIVANFGSDWVAS